MTYPSDAKKKCFKCGRRKLRKYFYRHPSTADGLLGKCRSCTKGDVASHRDDNRTKIAQYERRRSATPSRRAAVAVTQKRLRARHPGKYRARYAVRNAIRDGRLQKKPCKVCGAKKVQAHHQDYRKPLVVTWLCFEHHREGHGHVVSK